MAPHEQAEEFISSYLKLMPEDLDVNNFQKVLEMKVQFVQTPHADLPRPWQDVSMTTISSSSKAVVVFLTLIIPICCGI